jgi:plasmid maintenance system antidote protein VapI
MFIKKEKEVMAKNEFNPDYKVAPSEHIQEFAAYFISERAEGVDPDMLLELISGDKKIDDEGAILLEKVFGYSKELWIALQKDYDERIK